jgi:serine/threonine-protein kinase
MIELRLLGRLSLTGADGREVRTLLGQPRRFALLAYLAAATPPGFHRRDSLLALFWPELDQEHARTALRQALRVLRTTLGAGVVVSRGDEEVGLDFGQVGSDVAALQRALDAREWLAAMDLYRGPLLEGFFISDAPEFERWLESERARLQDAAARAARALVEQYESRGNLTTASHWARRAVELAPNDEAFVRRLIALLDHHGDRAGALEAYEMFRHRLAEDYSAAPAAETQALVAAVRARARASPPFPLPAIDLLARLQAGLSGRYRIERELARGRTATVFLAHDPRHDRAAAIKVLHPELAAAVGPERFLREIQLAARLDHPHIVALHDSGEADGLLYFVMPCVVGESLRDRLDREPQLPITDALRIAGDVAAALGYAHGLGVVHRDIKPENILLADGRALVADFGIARAITAAGSERLTETGIALGTPAYMSPEQATEDGDVDGRSDVYALGCVVYEMLAGTPPFTGPTAQAILARHAVDPVAPIRTVRDTVAEGIEAAVLKALAKVPADRFPSAAAFAHALAAPSIERRARVRLPRTRKARLALGVGLSAVAVVALLVGLDVGGRQGHARVTTGGTWLRSVAVLPLDNLSGDTTQDGFADGMTTALITDLGRIRTVRVISKRSVMPFKTTALPARAIGESLHVDALLEGGVERLGDRFRVDLELLDAASGSQLWADRFEDATQNRFAVQDAAARGVLAALKLPVTAAEAHGLRTPPTTNLEAYDLFLRGKIRVRHETRPDDSVAIALLQRAVALDPSFAVAHAWLARAYTLRVAQFEPRDSAALEGAFLATEKAFQLNPDLAEAHFARANLLWGATKQFAHERAIQEDRRAVELSPNLDAAHHHLGLVYTHIGLLDKAVEELRKTLAIDPGDWMAQERIAETDLLQGRYEEGFKILQTVPPEYNPPFWNFDATWALIQLGRNQDASVLIERYLHHHPEDRGGIMTGLRAVVFAKQGDARRAEADIQSAIQKGKGFVHFHHTAYSIASAYALLRQPSAAVEWLRRTADNGLPCYPLFASDRHLDNIRGDAAFVAFLREQKGQWERWRATL